MTEAELKHFEDRCLDETELLARDTAIQQLVNEVRRRGELLKDVEWVYRTEFYTSGEVHVAYCNWCLVEQDEGKGHAKDCPAFTEDGEVR